MQELKCALRPNGQRTINSMCVHSSQTALQSLAAALKVFGELGVFSFDITSTRSGERPTTVMRFL